MRGWIHVFLMLIFVAGSLYTQVMSEVSAPVTDYPYPITTTKPSTVTAVYVTTARSSVPTWELKTMTGITTYMYTSLSPYYSRGMIIVTGVTTMVFPRGTVVTPYTSMYATTVLSWVPRPATTTSMFMTVTSVLSWVWLTLSGTRTTTYTTFVVTVQTLTRASTVETTSVEAVWKLDYAVFRQAALTATSMGLVVVLTAMAALISRVAAQPNLATGFMSRGLLSFWGRLQGYLPDWLVEWIKSYGEDAAEEADEAKIKAPTHFPILTPRETTSLAVSTFVLAIAFSYATAPSLIEVAPALPLALVSSALLIVIKDLFKGVFSRIGKAWAEYKVWKLGIALLLISTALFKIPFSKPGRTLLHGEATRKVRGATSLSGILGLLAVTLPFLAFDQMGFPMVREVGIGAALTMVCYSMFPIWPLDGWNIFRWSRPMWAALFVLTLALYFGENMKILADIVYLLTGISASIVAMAIFIGAKRITFHSPLGQST